MENILAKIINKKKERIKTCKQNYPENKNLENIKNIKNFTNFNKKIKKRTAEKKYL